MPLISFSEFPNNPMQSALWSRRHRYAGAKPALLYWAATGVLWPMGTCRGTCVQVSTRPASFVPLLRCWHALWSLVVSARDPLSYRVCRAICLLHGQHFQMSDCCTEREFSFFLMRSARLFGHALLGDSPLQIDKMNHTGVSNNTRVDPEQKSSASERTEHVLGAPSYRNYGSSKPRANVVRGRVDERKEPEPSAVPGGGLRNFIQEFAPLHSRVEYALERCDMVDWCVLVSAMEHMHHSTVLTVPH